MGEGIPLGDQSEMMGCLESHPVTVGASRLALADRAYDLRIPLVPAAGAKPRNVRPHPPTPPAEDTTP